MNYTNNMDNIDNIDKNIGETSNIINKRILIVGGTGSLGCAIINKYVNNNEIICYSRDECKQWEISKTINNKNLKMVIGDMRDYDRLEYIIKINDPHIILIVGAMKHIDICEKFIHECIKTNINGVDNILNIVEKNNIPSLETVCFISTDKACLPVNVYGMCKAISERNVISRVNNEKIKFICVRYGNVLNSRGSIIPLLKKSIDRDHYDLTHVDMTRFIMTLDESVNLIEFAITNANSGDIVIPELRSMKIIDLLEIFGEKYNKPIKIIGLRPGEKLSESLVCESEIHRVIQSDDSRYKFIRYNEINKLFNVEDFNSKASIISKDELEKYLTELSLL